MLVVKIVKLGKMNSKQMFLNLNLFKDTAHVTPA